MTRYLDRPFNAEETEQLEHFAEALAHDPNRVVVKQWHGDSDPDAPAAPTHTASGVPTI